MRDSERRETKKSKTMASDVAYKSRIELLLVTVDK